MRKFVSTGAAALLVAGLLAVASAAPAGSSAFPGDNGKIAFTSNRDRNGNDEIYAMDPDGANQTNLTNNLATADSQPSWSADGKKIAFNSSTGGLSDIFVMNADGTNQHNLTNSPPANDSEPSWSPDGKKIAFTSSVAGNTEIWVMNADGSNPHNITSNPGSNSHPSWSPDGKKIAFNSGVGFLDVFVMNADGSNQHNITNNPAKDSSPSWSPDGEKIAFDSTRDASFEIFVMDADGSNPHNLTNVPTADDNNPAWSPDGEKIAFVSLRDLNREIYVMNADGTNQHDVSNNAADDSDPNWQPRSVDGDVTITKTVVGTPPPGTTFTVKVDCDGEQDDKVLTFGETGGTQSFERESFGPLECEVTEPATGGASTANYTCDAGENAKCHDNGRSFTLFEDPGDGHGAHITVTNTFAVTAEPTFTG